MIILRTTERVPCKLGDITVWVSPLSWEQKTSLYKHRIQNSGEVTEEQTKMIMDTLKLSVKRVDGINKCKFSDGSQVTLEWVDGKLTNESIEILISVLGPVPVSRLSSAILTDALTGKVEGFEIDLKAIEDPSKKKKKK